MAVLLCTMGALIVVLVVLNRQGRVEASTRAAATKGTMPDSDANEAAMVRDTIAWRLEHLMISREKTQADLDRERLRLSGIEEHIRSLDARLGVLRQSLAELDDAAGQESAEELTREINRLNAAIAAARARLEEAGKAASGRGPAYSVVPYDGRNRTRRRPIYIECRGDRVVIQPEGIELDAADFDGPPGPGNPLASAVRAARDHFVSQAADPKSPDAEPYPLFLVRPDGIEAYYAARAAMVSWGSDFGYQTIDQDWELVYPPADPQLTEIQRKAVEDARERTQWLVQLNRGRSGGGAKSKVTYRVSPLTGGLIRESGPSLREGSGNPLRQARGRPGGATRKEVDGIGGARESDSAAFAPGAQAREMGPSDRAMNSAADRSLSPSASEGNSRERHYGDLNDQVNADDNGSPAGSTTESGEPSTGDQTIEMSVASRQERPKSLAETRGVNWGLAPAARSSNPITRPIHILCEGNKLVLVADKANEPPVEIPLTQRTVDSIDLVAAAVQDRIKNWGLAGRGMYWRPQLILQVGKSGEGRYADLEALLADSGFDVKRR
jgi:hypothetical protein